MDAARSKYPVDRIDMSGVCLDSNLETNGFCLAAGFIVLLASGFMPLSWSFRRLVHVIHMYARTQSLPTEYCVVMR